MPAIVANAPNFLFNSDYPLDKVIYLRTESISLAAYETPADRVIAHGLGFAPLINAVWSTSSDFSVVYNITGGPPLGATYQYNTGITADATNVNITTRNNTASAVTLYFHIFAFMPSTVSSTVSATASTADSLMLTTDNNYAKLFSAGTITGPALGDQTSTVSHNLGYRPQITLWTETAGVMKPQTANIADTLNNRIWGSTDTTTLTVYFNLMLATVTVHYRIYIVYIIPYN